MAKLVKVIRSYMRSAWMRRLRSIWITPSRSDWAPSGGRGRLVRLEVKTTLSWLSEELSSTGALPPTVSRQRDNRRVSFWKSPSPSPSTSPLKSATMNVSPCFSATSRMGTRGSCVLSTSSRTPAAVPGVSSS